MVYTLRLDDVISNLLVPWLLKKPGSFVDGIISEFVTRGGFSFSSQITMPCRFSTWVFLPRHSFPFSDITVVKDLPASAEVTA